MSFRSNVRKDFPRIRASVIFSLFIYLMTRLIFDWSSMALDKVSLPQVLYLKSYVFSFVVAFVMLVVYFILYPIIHYTIADMDFPKWLVRNSDKMINRVSDYSLFVLLLFFMISFIMFLKVLTIYMLF